MDRPTRTRRLPLKLMDFDNGIVESTSTMRSGSNIAATSDDDREMAIKAASDSAAPKTRAAKGNLLAGKRTVVARRPRSPVLRDRTNFPVEPLKVDILVKKGADDKSAKKTAKATRQAAEPATTNEEVQAKAPGRAKSVRQTRAKNLQPEKENSENAPPANAKAKNIQTKERAKNVPMKEKATNMQDKEDVTNVPMKEKATEAQAKEDTTDVAMKEKARNTQATEEAKEKAKNARPKEKEKKTKTTKAAAEPDNEENSLTIESENAADVDDAPKMRSVRSGPKKTAKRVASSRLSTSRRSKLSVDNRKKKSLNRSPEARRKGRTATKSDVAAAKKFFKSKAPGAAANEEKIPPGENATTIKRRKIVEKPKLRVSTSFRLRQTTLGESFAKQALKGRLRPRMAQRNYRELTVLEKTVANDNKTTPRGPVYKTAKLSDKSDEDGSDVYEYHFDRNDTRERIPKRKKRKVGVAPRKTRAKASGLTKMSAKPKATVKKLAETDEVAEPQTKVPAAFDEPMDANDASEIPANDFDSRPPLTTKPIEPKKVDPPVERVETLRPKPMVLESVELTGEKRIDLTSTPQLTKPAETKARPPRAANARPTVQYRTMLKHFLLNRSLSPIKRALENFDAGSPWRSPALDGPQFSRVKNVVQSTPHIRKFSAMLEKNRNSVESTAEPARVNKIVARDENNENAKRANPMTLKVTSIPKIPSPAKVPSPTNVPTSAKSPRKFGTVISNVNLAITGVRPAIAVKNSAAHASYESPRKIESDASARLVDPSVGGTFDGNNDGAENFSDHGDKENSVPALTSPKKTLKSPRKLVARQSPLRPFNQAKTATKENWEPQPGPSGLQKRSPLGASRILKQSNLHNFLNIEQLPTSTRITSRHGIFADAHSTPIAGKPVRTIIREANIENAFGFGDLGDADVELSPIKHSLFADPPVAAEKIVAKRPRIEEKNVATVPTRFSIGEIKKHLRPVGAKDKAVEDDPVKRIEAAEEENREGMKRKTVPENEKNGNATNFSDTFDAFTAAEEKAKESVEEIPLFEDLEPIHFKQPPRHSYKRKRVVAFNLSEDEENDAESSFTGHENRGTKKRKVSKVEKQRLKKLEEWAKNLNNTFEEIDHFDLVVE